MSNAWTMLILAGVFEAAWAIGLKFSVGFTRPFPSLITIVAMIASVVLLARAVAVLPVGTAYAVWVGIGVVGAVLLETTLLGNPLTAGRAMCMGLLLSGVVGLKLLS